MKDVRLEPLGNMVMVQPLTARAREWMDENADAPAWAWQGGALAVEPRMVGALVEGMTAAGLEVEGDEPREALDPSPVVKKVADALQAAEKAGLTAQAVTMAADAVRAHEAGFSILEWQREALRGHGETPEWLTPIIEELKRADLLPWKETSSHKGPETP
jgi:hypothetical protein